ncbi:MAG: hypothetical protein WD119_01220 [Pirellulaceae bacterium]
MFVRTPATKRSQAIQQPNRPGGFMPLGMPRGPGDLVAAIGVLLPSHQADRSIAVNVLTDPKTADGGRESQRDEMSFCCGKHARAS